MNIRKLVEKIFITQWLLEKGFVYEALGKFIPENPVFIISAPSSGMNLPRIWYTNPFSNNYRIMKIRKLVKKKFITQWLLEKGFVY